MISNDTRNNRLNEAIKFAQSKKGKVIPSSRITTSTLFTRLQ